jgi:hypothetical protein
MPVVTTLARTSTSRLLSTYSAIRPHANLILVCGSGFGGADNLWPYLTGYSSDKNKIPTANYLSAVPTPVLLPADVKAKKEENVIPFTVGAVVPSTKVWLGALAGPKLLCL